MAVFDWPMIQCGKNFLNPIHYDKERLPNLRGMKITPPWNTVEVDDPVLEVVACNKNGELICVTLNSTGVYDLQKLDKTTCKLQPYCCRWEDNLIFGDCLFPHNKVVVEDDIVYILSLQDDFITLSVHSADGKSTQRCTLKFLEEFIEHGLIFWARMAVTNQKNVLIACFLFSKLFTPIYLCDDNGKLIRKFDPGLKDHFLYQMSVTKNGEIVLATKKVGFFTSTTMVHTFSADGQLQQSVKFCPSNEQLFNQLFYNQVTKKIIGYFGYNNCEEDILIEHFSSDTGELERLYLLHRTNIPTGRVAVIFHSSGALELVRWRRVIFLKHPAA